MDTDLVHDSRGEELLVDVGAHEPDPLVAGDLLGFREGMVDPVGDEREYRVRARRRPVGDDEARDLAQRALATPCNLVDETGAVIMAAGATTTRSAP